jgi:hypothetical protein
MMRIASCCAALLLVFLTLPAQAAQPGLTTDDFITSLQAGATGQPVPADLATGRRGAVSRATCIASCQGGTTVSCSYAPPATCVAVDANCPSTQGYVTCNGVTTYCSASCGSPPECTEGAIQWYGTGSCCAFKKEDMDKYQCIGGHWQYVITQCRLSGNCLN